MVQRLFDPCVQRQSEKLHSNHQVLKRYQAFLEKVHILNWTPL